jgi:hypothetical protein
MERATLFDGLAGHAPLRMTKDCFAIPIGLATGERTRWFGNRSETPEGISLTNWSHFSEKRLKKPPERGALA